LEAGLGSGGGSAQQPDPYKWQVIGIAGLFALPLPSIFAVMVAMQPIPPPQPWAVEAATLGVRPAEIFRGESVYRTTCAVCHGPSGDGVPSLGKPVHNSQFVQGCSDEELFRLIVEGRPVTDPLNTTGALMPPRGAQGMSDDRIRMVITYLRAIQDPDAPVASMAAWQRPAVSPTGATVVATGSLELADHPGHSAFVASCSACHGRGGEGIESQGLPLRTSGFVRGQSDKDLITFIKTGRASWDPNNTTGIDMPPKGGNPAITDAQLQSIVDYVRALQKEAMGS